MTDSTDVLIIGGGIAGLSAARTLTEASLRVTVLEARDRLGGRIFTQHVGKYPVEFGAEFVHGQPEEILGLAAEGGVPIVAVEGTFLHKEKGSWTSAGELMEEVNHLFSKMPAEGLDQSFLHYLDHASASEEVRQQALRYVEGFHAADPALISVQSLVRDSKAEEAVHSDHQYRMEHGYEPLVQAVVDRIDRQRCEILLNTVVTEIQWRPKQVTVRTAAKEFTAPRAIITLPLGVLKAHSVVFSPTLPEKENAISFLEMGPVIRVSLCFASRFWEQQPQFANFSFLLTDDPKFPTWWSNSPLPGPVLTGWAASRYGTAQSGKNKNEVVQTAIQSLSRIIGISEQEIRSQLIDAFTHDWQNDPFSRGAYSYAAVGGIDAARALAEPIANTLYFAGEATNSDGYNGTVHGAIATGLRAAKEVLQSR